jgi:hypothetical protein
VDQGNQKIAQKKKIKTLYLFLCNLFYWSDGRDWRSVFLRHDKSCTPLGTLHENRASLHLHSLGSSIYLYLALGAIKAFQSWQHNAGTLQWA